MNVDAKKITTNPASVFDYGKRNLVLSNAYVVVYDGRPFVELLLTDDYALAKYIERKLRECVEEDDCVSVDDMLKLAKSLSEWWVAEVAR